jgi:anaerobic dimethyl sulfoxide reductase subunit A
VSTFSGNISRRNFLKATAAATAAATLFGATDGHDKALAASAKGSSKPYDKVAHDDEVIDGKGVWVPIHCRQNCGQMCLNMGYVVDGVVVRQKTDDWHEDTWDCPQQRSCLRGHSLRQQIYNGDRIKGNVQFFAHFDSSIVQIPKRTWPDPPV